MKAFGVEGGALVAYDLALAQERSGQEWSEDPWTLVDQVMQDPALLSPAVRQHLSATIRFAYNRLAPQRKSLLKLVSRFTLSPEQAERFFVAEVRKDAGIDATDAALLENPYLLYELDRGQVDPVAVTTIDRGMFSDPVVEHRFPLPAPSAPDGPVDHRRSRALVIQHLEDAAQAGHALQPVDTTVMAVRRMEIRPDCPLSQDILAVVAERFPPEIVTVEMGDGSSAYQLKRLQAAGAVIRSAVERRLSGRRFEGKADWRKIVDQILGFRTTPRPKTRPSRSGHAKRRRPLSGRCMRPA